MPGAIGRLLLAARKAAISSTSAAAAQGWSTELSRELRKVLEGMVSETAAVSLRRKAAVFVEPLLVAEVEYRAWTNDGKLRHASFKGIREREDDAGVFRMK